MKLKFKIQNFQTQAVDSVCDLFLGANKNQSTFSVSVDEQVNLEQNEFGIGNKLVLSSEDVEKNMQNIQKSNLLPLTSLDDMQFSVEMETGTGKTYVYTKSIFEMNKKYGFTKFIIVVPSVAIREGVYKSLEITKEHFSNSFDNVPNRFFIYDSSKLSDIRQFATSSNIEIMIINIDAFKKSENIINNPNDKLNGETAMKFIQDTKPIVIIDEPQSVDNTEKSKEAISNLNPLCVLRYSATHKEKVNLLYRLTPVDAYNKGLVKQIVVSSNSVENDFNKPYVKLVSVSNDKGFSAKVEIDVKNKNSSITRKTITIKPNDDLYIKSGERELYEGYVVKGIDCTKNFESVEFSNTEFVKFDTPLGDIDVNLLKKAQIRRTIEAHFNKELRYFKKGIKVLSLFFIDKVENYRLADGSKGNYAEMFEEIYEELINLPKYSFLKEKFTFSTNKVHDGYFSQDKKGSLKDTKGDTIADFSTYNTIMKDKEWLLSFECPLRFIFSHSALKEGWDNPNVFQVCTLIDQKSVFTQRQKIGRGLRLCVNQDGERIEDKDINILHVLANESFAEFAESLQKEIEAETGIKFGILQLNMFAGMKYVEETTVINEISTETAKEVLSIIKPNEPIFEEEVIETLAEIVKNEPNIANEVFSEVTNNPSATLNIVNSELKIAQVEKIEKELTHEEANELMEHFEEKGYISKVGKVKDTLKNALSDGTLDLPKKFEIARDRLEDKISKSQNNLPIRNASKEVVVKLNKHALLSADFQEIWNKIKQRTAYRVTIDTEKLVKNCVNDLKNLPPIPKAKILTKTAEINILDSGINSIEGGFSTLDVESTYSKLPNILSIISEETLLKRDTIRRILLESKKSQEFLKNPQVFLEKSLDIIKRNRHKLAIDGIEYVKLQGEEYYAMEIFNAEELTANIEKNAIEVGKSLYNYVIYDSQTIEKPFAKALNDDPLVKMFFKLPSSFKIDTPIGSYNPDWAVYMDINGSEKLYFILETKGTDVTDDLRNPEKLKIHCGKEHFKALDVSMNVATNWKKFRLEN